jgi:hypothetical protein
MTSHTMITRAKFYTARRATVRNILQYCKGIKGRIVTRSISKQLDTMLYPNYVAGVLQSNLKKKPRVFFRNSLWIMI